MNLIWGSQGVFSKDGMRMGKICLGGAVKNVPLDLLPDAEYGRRLLVCDGVAIARVAAVNTLEDKYVSSDTWCRGCRAGC